MNAVFNHQRATRNNLLKVAQGLSLEQLNRLPENFNNNLIWQLGHVIVTQQLLVYGLSNQPLQLSDELLIRYRKGSKPEGDATEAEWREIKKQLAAQPEQAEKDFNKGLFQEFNTYETSYGITLHSIEDALRFVNLHEALHLGYAMAQRRSLNSTQK